MAVIEEELQRLWQVLAELSSQLSQNKEQTESLKRQAQELKTQAIHTGTGYPLKRFNLDLSKEQFESEIERMNAQLVVENQTLQHENRNLTILLKDHETTLEQIMARFRNHAHSTQQHELDLTKYYEALILSIIERQNTPSTTNELDPNTFQLIQNLSILIQNAIRELSGEDPPSCLDNQTLLTFQDPFKTPSTSNDQTQQRRKSMSVIDYRPRIKDPASGGYVGKRNSSLSDYALISAIETERLRRENDYLREMLGIAEDCSLSSSSSSTILNTPTTTTTNNFSIIKLSNNNIVSDVIKEEDEADLKLVDNQAPDLWSSHSPHHNQHSSSEHSPN